MELQQAHFEYLLRLGDNALVLGQRLSEWCGFGPILEQDIAITNIALDQIGQARSLLAHAGQVEAKGRDEDQLAYLRDVWNFRNVLLVEHPNGDWACTMVRQFLFDSWNFYFYEALLSSRDEQLRAIAEKSIKEITYHLRFSSEWVIRLGDGTEESHRRMQEALDILWMFSGELLQADEVDQQMLQAGIGVDLEKIAPLVTQKRQDILKQATLVIPSNPWMQSGGKKGVHSEYLGHLLSSMQFMQRAYPNLQW